MARPAAEAALVAAREICQLESAECVLLRVVVPPIHPISPSIEHNARYLHDYIEAGIREAESYLGAIGRADGAVVRRDVVVDHQPARVILQAAEDVGADLIASLSACGSGTAGAIGWLAFNDPSMTSLNKRSWTSPSAGSSGMNL